MEIIPCHCMYSLFHKYRIPICVMYSSMLCPSLRSIWTSELKVTEVVPTVSATRMWTECQLIQTALSMVRSSQAPQRLPLRAEAVPQPTHSYLLFGLFRHFSALLSLCLHQNLDGMESGGSRRGAMSRHVHLHAPSPALAQGCSPPTWLSLSTPPKSPCLGWLSLPMHETQTNSLP